MQAKSKKSPTPKKITIAEAFRMWMGGTGRSKLAPQTGLTKGELHQQFVKLAKKPWGELNAERSGAKKSKRPAKKEGLRRAA